MRHIGIDLHTNSLTACYLDEDGSDTTKTYRVQGAELDAFLATVESDDHVAVEATGNTRFHVDKLNGRVAEVVVVAPWKFEVIRRSVSKTDKNDARALAFFLSKGMLPTARVKSHEHAEIMSLLHTREKMVRLRVTLQNKAHGVMVAHGLKARKETLGTKRGYQREILDREWSPLTRIELETIYNQLQGLRASVGRLDKAIAKAASALPGFESITSIKGIGAHSAAVLLSLIGDIRDFKDPGNLASYFGLVPRVSHSNDRQLTGRITKRGSGLARKTLVLCALIAKRHSSFLEEFYQRIKARRGAPKAIVATARKLLTVIYHTLKNGWVFDDFENFVIRA